MLSELVFSKMSILNLTTIPDNATNEFLKMDFSINHYLFDVFFNLLFAHFFKKFFWIFSFL